MASQREDVYATLLLNNSYLPGAMVLAHSLKDAGTKKKLAVLFTPDSVSVDSLTELRKMYNYLIPVERVVNGSLANLYLMGRGDLHSTFTKINLWKLLQFRKIVYMDADVLALRAPDELFDIPEPFSAAPDIGWPDIFNTGVMVLTPNMGDYYALDAMAKRGISFDGADQGLLNMHFKNYNRLSFTYNVTPSAHYQYLPAYRYFQSSISAAHFIGQDKPWNLGRESNHGSSPYDEMIGRWWAVYDKHYRIPSPQAPPTGTAPIVQYYVKGEWNPSTPSRPVTTVAPPPRQEESRSTGSFYSREERPNYGIPDVPRHVEDAHVPPVISKVGDHGEQYLHYPEVEPEPPHQEYQPPYHHDHHHQEEHRQDYHDHRQEHQEHPQEHREHHEHHHEHHQEHHQEHHPEHQQHHHEHQQAPQEEHRWEHQEEHREEPREEPAHVISQTTWNPSVAPPPADSRPEASNFPATHYDLSSDLTPFQAPERYPEPPKNMWYEVPTAPSYQPPAPLFPWETHAPKPTRVFPGEGGSGDQPVFGGATLPVQGTEKEEKAEDEGSSGTSAPETFRAEPSPGESWASYSRANVWDEMPEIERYISAIQRNRKGQVQVLHSRSPSGAMGPSSSGTPTGSGRRVSLKLTDFPTEVERPSLPVTPAPVRPATFWGDEQEEEGEGELPAAVGVPAQEDWNPTDQLDKLARDQTVMLTTKLLRKDSASPTRDIPDRVMPFGSEGMVSPTYVPQAPRRSLDRGDSEATIRTRWSQRSKEDEEKLYGSQASTAATTVTGTKIEEPSYSGPGAAWEKDDEAVAPEETAVVLPSEEEQDALAE